MSENSVAQSPSENTIGKKLLAFGVSALSLIAGVNDAEAADRFHARQGRGSHAYEGTNQQAPVYIPPVQQQFNQQPQQYQHQQPQGYPQQNYQPQQGYPQQQYQHPQYRYNPNVERYPSPPPSPPSMIN